MRIPALMVLTTVLALLAAGPTGSQDLGSIPPTRIFTSHEPPPADAEQMRQGGDTWEEAVPISGVPFLTSGTNVGYSTNCCMEMCPYEAWGPAVFYSFTPPYDIAVRIDLCGSEFDTGLYVFDVNQDVVACNVDYFLGTPCGPYVSAIEGVELLAGEFYYTVVTGQSGASGNYVLEVTEFTPCELDPPAEALPEGEPPLVYGYVDAYNGGCNSPEFGNPFQDLVGDAQGTLTLAGRSGWYQPNIWQFNRDTDWFTAIVGDEGVLEVTLLAEQESYLYELGPLDCESVGVFQAATADPCVEASLTVTADPGSLVWLWVGPATFSPPNYPPGNEYDYILYLVNLMPGVVSV